ncbi:SDR family NAD(P)-dependent oxidoreductase [Agaribacterium haliotis]|uniref:SDR family NAD(P)-dependent oxidoreductase n=1 Tax=Agaribacterium haliotis TaxID=2013869 RepID=UPI000BB570D2|nr:SDR family NAD(P)-dependent oxidoreductase [Agaribacterium haliotis]
MELVNKYIVVTGATAGVGYELVRQLHTNNKVIAVARNADKLAQLQQQFEGVVCYQADLSCLDQVETVADQLVKHFAKLDVLINNAAVQNTAQFLDDAFVYDDMAREIQLNFGSVCALSYLLLPSLLHDQPAAILNINSGLALTPKTSSAVYCATKAALNSLTLALRYQLAQSNIVVQQALLDLVDTDMTRGRGQNKMSAAKAAAKIIDGFQAGQLDHDIGKVKLLRLLMSLAPPLARKIMKRN